MTMFESCLVGESDVCNEFHSARNVVARKEHVCGECGVTINVGDIYEYVGGKCEGDFYTFKTCKICVQVRVSLFKGSYLYGELWESIHEEFCYGGEEDDFCICPDRKQT